MELIAEKYKQTEVGLIPIDWEVKTIGDVFTFYSTSNFSKAEMLLYGEVGCIHYGLIHAIENSHYSLSNGIKYYINKEQAKYEAIQEGDVIMVDASEDLVGLNKSVEILNLNNKEYIAGLHTFHLRDKNLNYIDKFRGLILNSNAVKKQMLKLAVGMKVFGVSKPQLQQISIPVPTKAEQTAIATALTDADALIISIEKLIAKKRMIKLGAMQKLLNPIDNGELIIDNEGNNCQLSINNYQLKKGWEVKTLGEIFIITAGGDLDVDNFSLVKDDKYCYPIYSNALTNKGLYGYTSQYKQHENTITVTARGQVGVAVPRDHKYCAIGRVLMLSPSIELDINFISECINNFIEFSNESTGVPQLTAPQISKYEITIPDFKEQTRIATILSDMDAEISALETKLEKYKKVKLGMMQNLLTGKIRLI